MLAARNTSATERIFLICVPPNWLAPATRAAQQSPPDARGPCAWARPERVRTSLSLHVIRSPRRRGRAARRQMDRPPFTQPLTILPRIVLMSEIGRAHV